jgi:hypothetical protein
VKTNNLPIELNNKHTEGSSKPHMNQSLYTLPSDTLPINMRPTVYNGNSHPQQGKTMRDESEKLKYQIPHHIHGAPNWGLNGIESIQWR